MIDGRLEIGQDAAFVQATFEDVCVVDSLGELAIVEIVDVAIGPHLGGRVRNLAVVEAEGLDDDLFIQRARGLVGGAPAHALDIQALDDAGGGWREKRAPSPAAVDEGRRIGDRGGLGLGLGVDGDDHRGGDENVDPWNDDVVPWRRGAVARGRRWRRWRRRAIAAIAAGKRARRRDSEAQRHRESGDQRHESRLTGHEMAPLVSRTDLPKFTPGVPFWRVFRPARVFPATPVRPQRAEGVGRRRCSIPTRKH